MRGIVIDDAGSVPQNGIQHITGQVGIAEKGVVPAAAHHHRTAVSFGMGGQCLLQARKGDGVAQPRGLHKIGAAVHQMHMGILKSGQNQPPRRIQDACT